MRTEVNINTEILTWAIDRAGYELNDFFTKLPNSKKWIEEGKKPTVKQLEDFSKKVYLPFGYLLLSEPPKEKLPFPFFRTLNNDTDNVNVNVYDTILFMQQRQDWLIDYLEDNYFDPLMFVGKFNLNENVNNIVKDIRNTLGLEEKWASNCNTWEMALNVLTEKIEEQRIIVVFNGVVENNNYRKIKVEDCRGFVLVDKLAPFMFINNSDSKSAQMFTLVHELAHIWLGQSAGFDYRKLQPAEVPIEILCDKVAAEFLVPSEIFIKVWNDQKEIKSIAKYFKVSEIVIARRALDMEVLNKDEFFNFYDEYINRELIKKEDSDGGNFYATTKKRLSMTFASYINEAVKSGKLLYRDAYKMTSLKRDTFHKFFTDNFKNS